VSLLDGISGADARWRTNGPQRSTLPTVTGTGGQPNASQALSARFSSVFQQSFNQNMATVFERGVSGAFDDPTIKLQEQAALQRLRAAAQGARHPAPATHVDGADAAPTSPAVDHSAEVAARRDLNEARVRQSEARLDNISSSLAAEFPKAAAMPSASTGSWDPATFVPRSAEEAEAFAQRMVIDATEGAARLEIVQTQLDAATFEARAGSGDPAKVAQLQAAYDRQRAYVDKLAAIVDGQSGGMVTDAGEDAMGGHTLRGANDMPVEEIEQSLRASGMSERQIRRVIGATELSVEEEKTPGGSPRLREISSAMTASLIAKFDRDRERFREEERKTEEQQAIARRRRDERAQEKRAEAKRLDARRAAERREQEALRSAALDRAAARRRAL